MIWGWVGMVGKGNSGCLVVIFYFIFIILKLIYIINNMLYFNNLIKNYYIIRLYRLILVLQKSMGGWVPKKQASMGSTLHHRSTFE